MNLAVAVIAYIACGIVGYGITFGYFQNEFQTVAREWRTVYRCFAVFVGLLGPVGILVCAVKAKKHPMEFGLTPQFQEKLRAYTANEEPKQ
jgi:hypothetical protein